MVCIYIEKVCDRVLREVRWNCEERIVYLSTMLLKICMSERRLRIRMLERGPKDFLADIRLYQRFALSPFFNHLG